MRGKGGYLVFHALLNEKVLLIFLSKSGKGGGRLSLFGSDGPCAVTSIRTILLLLL